MKRLLTLAFIILCISGFSQVRTNIFRVAGDSTDISASSPVPASLVVDDESKTLYFLPSGCAAGKAIYEVTNKYVLSTLIGQTSGSIKLGEDITKPPLPKYLVINPDGTTGYTSGVGGVDTIWLVSGSEIHNRPDIDSVSVLGNLYIDEMIYNDLIEYDDSDTDAEGRLVYQNTKNQFVYYPIHRINDSVMANVTAITDNINGVEVLSDTCLRVVYSDGSFDTLCFFARTETVGGYWKLDGTDTINTENSILLDSTLLMHYKDWYLGFLVDDPYDDPYDSTLIIGHSDGTRTGYIALGNENGSSTHTIKLISKKVDTNTMYIQDYNYIYMHATDATSTSSITINPSSTTVQSGGYRFLHYKNNILSFGLNSGNETSSGAFNIAIGDSSMLSNTHGYFNTSIGHQSLMNNTYGYGNTTVGHFTLFSNIDGSDNTAIGYNALYSNISGQWNIALGEGVLSSNTDGHHNIAGGGDAMNKNIHGYHNVAIGDNAIINDTNATNNVIIGSQAATDAINSDKNIVIGRLGAQNLQSGSNNIVIGDSSFLNNPNGDYQLNIGGLIKGNLNPLSLGVWCYGDFYIPEIDSASTHNILYYDEETGKTTYAESLISFSGDDITTNGDITYGNTYWNDLNITNQILEFTGSSDPTLITHQTGGASGITIRAYEFEKNDEAFFQIQVPHDIKLGSDFKVHVHWTPGTRGNKEGTATVGWKVDYSMANINEAFANAKITVDCSDGTTSTDYVHLMSTPVLSDPGTVGVSAYIVGRIYRSDTGTDDTWSGSTTGQLPILLGVDFHYEIDKPGTDD